MATHRYINIALPEGERLLSLNGVWLDLQSARDACKRLINEPLTGDMLIQDAILNLAIIKYGRCFNGGIRCIKFDEMKACLNTDQIEIHQLFLEYRSKHIAHSINAFETHRVRAYLIPEERGKGVASVSAEGHYLLRPEIKLIISFLEVIEKLIDWIEDKKRIEEHALKSIIEAKYPIETLYAMDADFPPEIHMSDVKKGRSLTKH